MSFVVDNYKISIRANLSSIQYTDFTQEKTSDLLYARSNIII